MIFNMIVDEGWRINVLRSIDFFTAQRETGTGSITLSADQKTAIATTTGTGSNDQGNVVYFSNILFDAGKYQKLHFHLNKTGVGPTHVGLYSSNTSYYSWENVVARMSFNGNDPADGDYEINLQDVDGMCYFAIGLTGFHNDPWAGGTNTSILTNVYLA